ncbi:MAG TPA: hypothetical protein VHO48_07870, partial [Anaerolineaceae bacterium]|nr:hypothetical protein [Anaerolineaceae bacterium]
MATIILMAAFRPGIHPVTATVENKVYLPNISRSSSIQVNGTNTLIPTSYTWKYLDNGTDQGTAWRQSNYDDRQWKSGPAELGYGDGDERTRVNYGSDPSHKYVTTYFRSQFTATAISSYESLTIRLNRDDAAIVYLNGIEIYRNNLPDGEVGYRTYAKSAADGTIEARVDKSALVEGTNLLAVEIHQASASSSDISFSLVLIANIGAPVVQPTDTPSTRPTTQPTEPPTQGNAWYVAPNGSSSGQGTMASPWDLSTALAYPAAVHPGDTIWLRGGTYGSGGTTEFQSNLQGSSGNFITVRAFPGEKVTVDGSFMILKGYVTFWGLEVLNSNTTRVTAESGSHPSDERGDGFGVYAPNVRLINNIVH